MNNNTISNLKNHQNNAKYAQGRSSLLALIVFSAINIISIPLLQRYFLFSAYFASTFSGIGYALYDESHDAYDIVFYSILAVISLLPYIACWIFSKKHVGWMIGALAIFSIETVLLAIDSIAFIMEGDISMILDLVFHAYVLFCLIQGVKFGLKVKKDEENEPIVTQGVPTEEAPELVRTLKLIRPKSFVGSAVRLVVLIDGNIVGDLGNNESKDFRLPEASVLLSVMSPDGSVVNSVTIPEGYTDSSYTVSVKTGFSAMKIIVEPSSLAK